MINIDYKEETTNTDEYLRYCQLIIQAFTKALDQNECTVKVLVGIHNEINDQKQTLQDLWDLTRTDNYKQTGNGVQNPVVDKQDEIKDIVEDKEKELDKDSVLYIKDSLKNRCIDCDYDWPKINFANNFKFSFDKLKASLQAYTDAFDKITNPNFCQTSTAFEFACLQDIIKLITLLLSVFSAILAIRKISNISLNGFIKGVISGLLGQLIGSLRLQFDLSQTGLSCLINAISTIANNIPDGQSVSGYIPENWFTDAEDDTKLVAKGDDEYITVSQMESYVDEKGNVQNRVKSTTKIPVIKDTVALQSRVSESDSQYTDAKLKAALADLKDPKNQNIVKQFTKAFKRDASEYEKQISNSFNYVNDVIEKVQQDFNENVSQIFGLVDYFQCEAGRTGTDFLEILEYLQQIINVINLLSSIAALVAKKHIEKMCKTKDSVSDLTEEEKEVLVREPNQLDPVDILEEFLEKVVEKTVDENDEIIPIIYDKPKEPILPKLSLDTCNLNDFIKSHTIDKIIDKVVEDIRKEKEEERLRENKPKPWDSNGLTPNYYDDKFGTYPPIDLSDVDRTRDPGTQVPFKEVTNKKKWDLYPIQFVKPDFNIDEINNETKKEDNKAILEKNLDSSFGVKTILDFVYNNPTDKIVQKDPKKEAEKDYFNPNLEDISVTTKPENNKKRDLKTPPTSEYSPNSETYKNTCRDIGDVLSKLESLKGM